MGAPIAEPVCVHTDSSAAKDMTVKRTTRDKRLDLKDHFTKDLVSDGTIAAHKVPTADNPADLLTKAVTAETLERLREALAQAQ